MAGVSLYVTESVTHIATVMNKAGDPAALEEFFMCCVNENTTLYSFTVTSDAHIFPQPVAGLSTLFLVFLFSELNPSRSSGKG